MPPARKPGPEEARLFLVHGHVQGVGFRWWVRAHGQRLDLSGHVRNRTDGTVEVRARGEPSALSQLRDLLRQGPTGARVDRVEVHPAPDTPAGGFEIVA